MAQLCKLTKMCNKIACTYTPGNKETLFCWGWFCLEFQRDHFRRNSFFFGLSTFPPSSKFQGDT